MKKLPQMKHNKHNGDAYCYVNRKYKYLGRYGTKEARDKYLALLKSLDCNNNPESAVPPDQSKYTLCALVADWIEKLEAEDNCNLCKYRTIAKKILANYSDMMASDFGGRALKRLQADFVEDNLSRHYINQLINMTRTMFKWALSEELIGADQFASLKAVTGLVAGKTKAREIPKRQPADTDSLNTLRQYASDVIADMLLVQYLTGCRDKELVSMRMSDIDIIDGVPTYYPPNKNGWRDRDDLDRSIPIPKCAWDIVKKRAENQPEDWYIFNPFDGYSNRDKNKRVNRQYTSNTYAKAIRDLFKKIKKQGVSVKKFTPYQLRHLAITEVSRKFGVEYAGAFAGHHSDVTRRYDHSDSDKAALVAGKR